MSEILVGGGSDAYAADVKGEQEWYRLGFAGGPDFGQCASILVNYDQLREMCSTVTLSLPKSVLDLIHLAVRSVPRYLFVLFSIRKVERLMGRWRLVMCVLVLRNRPLLLMMLKLSKRGKNQRS